MSVTQLRSLLGAFLFTGDDVDKGIGVLSGGEKARVALVKMLLTPANVLLLDEPTNHLDMASRAVLEQALAAFTGTIVVIGDRHFLDAVCNEVWEIDDGRITPFLGSYSDYKERSKTTTARVLFHFTNPIRKGGRKIHGEWQQRKPSLTSLLHRFPFHGRPAGVTRRKSKDEKRRDAQRRADRAGEGKRLRQTYTTAESWLQSSKNSSKVCVMSRLATLALWRRKPRDRCGPPSGVHRGTVIECLQRLGKAGAALEQFEQES